MGGNGTFVAGHVRKATPAVSRREASNLQR